MSHHLGHSVRNMLYQGELAFINITNIYKPPHSVTPFPGLFPMDIFMRMQNDIQKGLYLTIS